MPLHLFNAILQIYPKKPDFVITEALLAVSAVGTNQLCGQNLNPLKFGSMGDVSSWVKSTSDKTIMHEVSIPIYAPDHETAAKLLGMVKHEVDMVLLSKYPASFAFLVKAYISI